MDLLLTHGYFLYEDPKELQIMKPYVPLGILYICSHLRAKGMAVEVFDTTFSSRAQLFEILRSTPTRGPRCLRKPYDAFERYRDIEGGKRSGLAGHLGGPEPGAYTAEYLEAGADVVVIGEGEVTVEELVPTLRACSPGCGTRRSARGRSWNRFSQ